MQPNSGVQPKVVNQGAGTTLLRDTTSVFKNLFIPQTTAGTVSFYNSPTTAGTSASNLLFTIPTIQGTPLLWEPNYSVNGLVAVTSGTVNFVVGVL